MSEEKILEFSDVRAWVEENLDPMMDSLGISHWRIEVVYDSLKEESNSAEIISRSCYERAWITIDPLAFSGRKESELRSTFEHELLHVMHAPFSEFWRTTCGAVSEEVRDILLEPFLQACEGTVRNLERLVYAQRNRK